MSEKTTEVSYGAKEKNTLIESISGVVICIANITATLALLLGVIRIGGESISVFSSIEMVLGIFDISTTNAYWVISDFLIGLTFITVLIKTVIAALVSIKVIPTLFNVNAKRKAFKGSLNRIMQTFYTNISGQFALVIMGGLLISGSMDNSMIFYFAVCLLLFLVAYSIRLKFYTGILRDYIVEIVNAVMYISAVVIVIRLCNVSAIQSIYQNALLLSNLQGSEVNLKLICTLIYSLFGENLLFLTAAFCALGALTKMFRHTIDDDMYFFGDVGSGRKIAIFSGIIIICRSVIELYFQSSGGVDTEDGIAVIKYIVLSNRYDAIPLLLLGISMIIISAFKVKRK